MLEIFVLQCVSANRVPGINSWLFYVLVVKCNVKKNNGISLTMRCKCGKACKGRLVDWGTGEWRSPQTRSECRRREREGEREDGQRPAAFKNGVSGGKWVKNIKTRPAFFILPRSFYFFCFFILWFVFAPAWTNPSSPFPSVSGETRKNEELSLWKNKKAALFYFDASLLTASICC